MNPGEITGACKPAVCPGLANIVHDNSGLLLD